jgi:hypothetical protein
VGGRAIDDAHDERAAAAILKELLDRVAHRRGLPQSAEELLELAEACDGKRAIDRPFERSADEGSHRSRCARDRACRAAECAARERAQRRGG